MALPAATGANDGRAADWVTRPASAGWGRADLAERFVQGFVAVLLAAALGLGMALVPSPTGMGTHTQLGLPECGMLLVTGHPCPTCGVTTSFVLAAHGRFAESFVNQPFGLVVFLCALGGLVFCVATLVTGRSWLPLLSTYSILVPIGILVALALVSWAYKWSMMNG